MIATSTRTGEGWDRWGMAFDYRLLVQHRTWDSIPDGSVIGWLVDPWSKRKKQIVLSNRTMHAQD